LPRKHEAEVIAGVYFPKGKAASDKVVCPWCSQHRPWIKVCDEDTKSGFMNKWSWPPLGQKKVMLHAWQNAEVDPDVAKLYGTYDDSSDLAPPRAQRNDVPSITDRLTALETNVNKIQQSLTILVTAMVALSGVNLSPEDQQNLNTLGHDVGKPRTTWNNLSCSTSSTGWEAPTAQPAEPAQWPAENNDSWEGAAWTDAIDAAWTAGQAQHGQLGSWEGA